MNYELCKKLKDTGFLQENSFDERTSFINNRSVEWYGDELKDEFEPCKIPTLSELIEACGDDFEELRYNKEDKIWFANSWHFGYGGFDEIADGTEGKTPEEAVAKLWLKLNFKRK